MTPALLLLGLYCGLAGYMLVKIGKRDIFFAIFFMFLILYSAPAMLGYILFPELSKFGGMYFGVEIIPSVIGFTLASLCAMYFFFRTIYLPVSDRTRVRMATFPSAKPVVILIVAALLAMQVAFFLIYARNLNYSMASDEELIASLGLPYKVAFQEFKCSSSYIVAMYGLCVLGSGWKTVNKVPFLALFAAHVLVFVGICVQLGNRVDLLHVLLGILFIEVMRRADPASAELRHWPSRVLSFVSPLTWIFGGAIAVAFMVAMSIFEHLRSPDILLPTAPWFAQNVLFKDYYLPFHMLILAMADNYVDPVSVLISNSANTLILLNVPYLQHFVMDHSGAGYVTRSASLALYVFTEGFVAAGWLGFVYNGFVLTTLLTIWRLLSRTGDRRINVVAGALCVAMAAGVARGQTSYLIKDLYISLLPALLLFCLAIGRIPISLRFSRDVVR